MRSSDGLPRVDFVADSHQKTHDKLLSSNDRHVALFPVRAGLWPRKILDHGRGGPNVSQ